LISHIDCRTDQIMTATAAIDPHCYLLSFNICTVCAIKCILEKGELSQVIRNGVVGLVQQVCTRTCDSRAMPFWRRREIALQTIANTKLSGLTHRMLPQTRVAGELGFVAATGVFKPLTSVFATVLYEVHKP
jgi:hypothetical protein